MHFLPAANELKFVKMYRLSLFIISPGDLNRHCVSAPDTSRYVVLRCYSQLRRHVLRWWRRLLWRGAFPSPLPVVHACSRRARARARSPDAGGCLNAIRMLALQPLSCVLRLAPQSCANAQASAAAPAVRQPALCARRWPRVSIAGWRAHEHRAGRRGHVCCAARGNGDDPRAPKLQDAGDVSDDFDEDFEDFPGADSARQWRALPADTRSLITAGVGFIAVPVLLSWSLRLTVIDPLLFYLQADLHEFDLTPRQWNEITLELEGMERRLKYDGLMGHAPRLTEPQMEDRLREEGLLLEYQQRQRSREVRVAD